MKFIIVFAALFAIALAAPAEVEIVHQESDVLPESFSYSYGTSDGTSAQASGVVKNVGSDDENLSVSGSFTYVGPDGVAYTVDYLADENGFQPVGSHLPTV